MRTAGTDAPASTPPTWHSRWRNVRVGTIALILATSAGIAVRVALWWQNRSFWRDELALVQSLDDYSARRLLGPLSDAQAAPPGWLLAIRAATKVFGDSERAYRMLPLLAGCLTLVLLALLAVRLTRSHWAATVPVVMFATVSELVFYSAQTKPYTTDTLLVTALLLVAVVHIQTGKAETGKRHTGKGDLVWYACLAVFPWFSHGAMLSIPLLACWVAVVHWRRRQRSLAQLSVRLAFPAASVLAAALWSRHLTNQVPDFATYWDRFLGPETPSDWWHWTTFAFQHLAHHELGARLWWAGLALAVAGAVAAFQRSKATAPLLVLPTITAYVAGLLGVYPFGHRLISFCVPGLVICVGVLVDETAARVGRNAFARAAAGVLTAALILTTVWTTPTRLHHDLTYLYGGDDYRSALTFVASKWNDSDLLLVGNGDRAAVRVYGPRLGLPAHRTWRAIPTTDKTPRHNCPLPTTIAHAPKIWLITGDVVTIYTGTTSRTALAAPLLQQFHVAYAHDKGRVTVQTLIPGAAPKSWETRCLTYKPVGPPGTP
nr:glycosyltransferase family 39 protein [Tenggerimyces flavus]